MAGFVVRTVVPGQVVVDGPSGVRTLRLEFGGVPMGEAPGPQPAAPPRSIPIRDLLRHGTALGPPTPGLPTLGPPPADAPPGEGPGLRELLRSPMRDIGVPGLAPQPGPGSAPAQSGP